MAGNGGHLLVMKAMRLVRSAVDKTAKVIRDRLPQAVKTAEEELQPVYVRVTSKQPISRIAAIRQSQSRYFSTKPINNSIRHFSSTSNTVAPTRAALPSSRTGNAVRRITSRAPFASTLRPSLTGGALGRTAGGYGTGAGRVGGVRYFSHSPTAPAEVVNNVSQAVRAFWLSGQRARFDGSNPRTGEKRYRAVSDLQDKTHRRMQISNTQAPGAYLDFKVTPTITAIGPLSTVPRSSSTGECELEHESLNNAATMTTLSADFSRALKDLAAIMNDLKRLATLGDLPISLPNSTTLRVRFPGCDADIVEALCQELNIRRGMVFQDPEFDAQVGANMALLFPFAPSKTPSEASYAPELRPSKRVKREDVQWRIMMSPAHSHSDSHRSRSAISPNLEEDFDIVHPNPWLESSPTGYSSLHASDVGEMLEPAGLKQNGGQDFEGLEGIHRFLLELDGAARK